MEILKSSDESLRIAKKRGHVLAASGYKHFKTIQL